MKLNTVKIKEYITEPSLGRNLRPLLLFNGNLTEGKAVSRFNFVRAAMDVEVPTLTELNKLSVVANDDAHLCGFHAKFGWNRMGMQGFFGRILQSPTVMERVAGLEDYIHWVFENTPHSFPFILTRISETSHWSNRDWRKVRKQRIAPMAEVYPYVTTTPTEDHELLLAVDRLVPKNLHADARADLCQDIIVQILVGELSLDNLRDAPRRYFQKAMTAAPNKYGALSLDAPQMFGDEMGRTLGETISSHR